MTAYSGLSFFMSRFQDQRVDALLLKELYRENSSDYQTDHEASNSDSDKSDSEISRAKVKFKDRIHTTRDFDLRFVNYFMNTVVSFIYSVCCKCCLCCASETRGPVSCRKRAR